MFANKVKCLLKIIIDNKYNLRDSGCSVIIIIGLNQWHCPNHHKLSSLDAHTHKHTLHEIRISNVLSLHKNIHPKDGEEKKKLSTTHEAC